MARLRVAWLAPDLALAMAALAMVYALLAFQAPRRLFRDADAGWHIRHGEQLLERGSLAGADPFSFSKGGQSWFAWEWGGDLAMGLAHRAAGLQGVVMLYLAAIGVGVWLWVRLSWAAGGDFLMACLLLSPALSTASLHWLARPHVFGWIFLLATLWAAERAPSRFRAWHAGLALLGGMLWANVHASFFLAPLVLSLYAAGGWVRPFIWNSNGRADRAHARWLAQAALCSLAGSFVNPFGWQLHRHVVSYLSDSELLARVAEFQSFNFHAEGATQIAIAFGAGCAGAVAALSLGHPGRFLVMALLLAGALRSARGLPLAAMAVLPLANGALAEALRRLPDWREPFRRALERILAYSSNLRSLDARFHGAALAPPILALTWLLVLFLPAGAFGFDPREFPVAAAERVATLPVQARLFCTDKFGGYLIYRFAGARPVWFDGRSDFYGAAFMRSYIRMLEARPGWRADWAAARFSHALAPAQAPLHDALRAAGWRVLFEDKTAALLERPPE